MKYVGSMIQARATRTVGGATVTALTRFVDVNLEMTPPVVDVGTANQGGEQFVDASGTTARLTATAVPDDTDGHNLMDVYEPGAVVDLTGISGIPQAHLDKFGPWQIGPGGIRHNRGQASNEHTEFIGTNGAVASSYTPAFWPTGGS